MSSLDIKDAFNVFGSDTSAPCLQKWNSVRDPSNH